MKNNRKLNLPLAISLAVCTGCAVPPNPAPVIPAVDYARSIRAQHTTRSGQFVSTRDRTSNGQADAMRARLRYASDGGTDSPRMMESSETASHYRQESPAPDYNGPLSLGDPGLTASLWRENRGDNDLIRDTRAWQPMDLVTILVTEKAEGSKGADTEVKSKSSISASIENLIGIEDSVTGRNTSIDPTSLMKASSQNDFKGEGETSRRGSLKATISAMVAEVLPSGILRIEGQKIISVNNEEQVMVISGLVRPRDINSENQIDSSRLANMRIDYYGAGIVGEAQRGGWLSRLIRTVWPF